MDGYEVTVNIRQQEAVSGHYIPIIGLTAHAMKDRERCRECGMDAYLAKPIVVEKLREIVRRLGYTQTTGPH